MAQINLPKTLLRAVAGHRAIAFAAAPVTNGQRAMSSISSGSGSNSPWNSRGAPDQGSTITTTTAESRKIHLGRVTEYPQVAVLPLPDNIDPNETIQFSPQRTRDINCQQISLATGQQSPIDVTSEATDPRMASYDAHAMVNLNAHMQSNVPEPFGSVNFSHLNMPGGQWAQNGKFMAQDLQSSHYTNLRQQVRSDWDKKGAWTVLKRSYHHLSHRAHSNPCHPSLLLTNPARHALFNGGVVATLMNYSTVKSPQNSAESNEKMEKTDSDKNAKEGSAVVPETKKMQLKRVFKEYGSTVIVFHVGISLASLGMFYALVSSGLDVMKIVEYFNLGDSVLASKVGAGAGTFVVAYAVHKIFAPVRISITLGATPFLVRLMRKRGILKK